MSQSEKITVVTAHMECSMCPSIYIGNTADGWTAYARYRWGVLSVRINTQDPAPFGGAGGVWILTKQIDPAGLDGCMSFEELKEHTVEIVNWPDELTSRSERDNLDETINPVDLQL